MRKTTFDKSRLAAFADGELSPEDAASVVMYLADHPEDQAYVDDLMTANAALAHAFAAPISEPVPPAILATIEGRSRVSAKIMGFLRPPVVAFGGMALAASVVLALLLQPAAPDFGLRSGDVAKAQPLFDHLQFLPSGQTVPLAGGQSLTILATLPVEAGFCREVEVIDSANQRRDVALACTEGNGWRIAVAVSETLPAQISDPGYVPASGTGVDALAPWLDRLGAGMTLNAAAETKAISGGWGG